MIMTSERSLNGVTCWKSHQRVSRCSISTVSLLLRTQYKRQQREEEREEGEGESLSGKLTTTKFAGGAYESPSKRALRYARKGKAPPRQHAHAGMQWENISTMDYRADFIYRQEIMR